VQEDGDKEKGRQEAQERTIIPGQESYLIKDVRRILQDKPLSVPKT
jgi:hypothetical protein